MNSTVPSLEVATVDGRSPPPPAASSSSPSNERLLWRLAASRLRHGTKRSRLRRCSRRADSVTLGRRAAGCSSADLQFARRSAFFLRRAAAAVARKSAFSEGAAAPSTSPLRSEGFASGTPFSSRPSGPSAAVANAS